MSIVNKPDVSGPLIWFYVAIVAFIAALGVFISYIYLQTLRIEVLVGLVVIVGVEVVIASLLASLWSTKYVLSEQKLIVKASVLVGGTKRIPLKSIESIERTLIPFGFRLFGASFYGGYYYFPGVGRAFMVMTNFKDGVLLKTKHGNYIITPKNPENFMQAVEKMRRAAQ
jgi:hypothetical protein